MSIVCQRCGTDREVKKHSWFDNALICTRCAVLEKGAPNFSKVHLAGLNALEQGFEIPGVGLSSEDMEYMEAAAPKWKPLSKRNGDELEYDDHKENDE